MTRQEFNALVDRVLQTMPEEEWFSAIRSACPPEVSDGEIISVVEIASGGDVIES